MRSIDDMDTTETITVEQFFYDAVFDLMRLRSVGCSFLQLADLFHQMGLDITAEEVAELYIEAAAARALAAPDGRVEVEIFGGGKGVSYFTDPDYPEGTVMVWPNGRQWLLVRNSPPRELPRLPRERWPRPRAR